MTRNFISMALTLNIHLQRFKDHTLRSFTGVPRAKRSMILPEVFLGGQYGLQALETFEEWGITAVVNMRMNSIHKHFATVPLHILHLPTSDFYAPTLKQLEKGVNFIKNEVDQGGKVYIHCRHGEGRGPTMAIAYLMTTGLTLEHAIQLVKKVRTFIHPTKDQLTQLRIFEKNILKKEGELA